MSEPSAPKIELPAGVVALIPMRNLVLFPHVLTPISVGREKSIAALTLLKSGAAKLGVAASMFENMDLHLHVPAGAIPNDGPCTGEAMQFFALEAVDDAIRHALAAPAGQLPALKAAG